MNLLIYLAGMLAFTSGFYFVKKSDCVWNGVCSAFLSYIVWMLVQSLICGLTIHLHNKVVAWQYGVLGIVVGGCLWVHILVKKQWQKYQFAWVDLFVAGMMMVSAVVWGRYQFGPDLRDFNFASVNDSAYHMYFARSLTENIPQTLDAVGQYFAAANTAVWMDAMGGILTKYYLYNVFICCELFVFMMNGAVFWIAIRRFLKNRFVTMVAIIMAFLYLFGHPCNSLVYGTSYFSTGIMLSILIYYVASLLIHKEISRIWGILLLVAAEIGLLHSYKMFLPVFLCGPILYLYYLRRVRRKEITIRQLYTSWVMWGLLAVLAMMYLFRFYTSLGIESDQTWEMYGHFYADYLFLFPFIILLFIKAWKGKKIGLEETLFFLAFCFVAAMFMGSLDRSVSTYYYYKSYAPLWSLAFLCVVKCFSMLSETEKEFPVIVFICWILLFSVNVTGLDQSLYQKNPRYEKSKEVVLFPVYTANQSLLQRMAEKQGLNDLIMETARRACEEDVVIPYLPSHKLKGGWNNLKDRNMCLKYRQRYRRLVGNYSDWGNAIEQDVSIEELRKGEYPYALLTCYYHHEECIEEMLHEIGPVEIIRRNEYGCLVALQKK